MSKKKKEETKTNTGRNIGFGCLGLIVIFVISFIFILWWGSYLNDKTDQRLKKIDELWKIDKNAAIAEYESIIVNDEVFLLLPRQRTQLFQRCVPYLIQNNDMERVVTFAEVSKEFTLNVVFTNEEHKLIWETTLENIQARDRNKFQFDTANLVATRNSLEPSSSTYEHSELIEESKQLPISGIDYAMIKKDPSKGISKFGIMMDTFIKNPNYSVKQTKNGTQYIRVSGKLPETVEVDIDPGSENYQFKRGSNIQVDVYINEYTCVGKLALIEKFLAENSEVAFIKTIKINNVTIQSEYGKTNIISYINMYGFRD